MKKTIIPLLALSILTASFPAQGMSSSYTWAKNNIYTLLGVGIAAIATFFVYTKYQSQVITKSLPVNHIKKASHEITKPTRGDIRIVKADPESHCITIISDLIGPRAAVLKALKLKGKEQEDFVTKNTIAVDQMYCIPGSSAKHRQPVLKSLALKHTHPEGKIHIKHGDTFAINLTIETPGRDGCITKMEGLLAGSMINNINKPVSKKTIDAHSEVTFL